MPTDAEELMQVESDSEINLKELDLGDYPSEPDLIHALFLRSLPSAQLQQLSPAALAYLGDAVYELYIRRFYLVPPKRIQTYHQKVVAQVRAETQATHLQTLLPHLTASEIELVKRGRNAATGGPKRIDPEIYQRATSLETLIGYLYLTNPQRLIDLLSQLELI